MKILVSTNVSKIEKADHVYLRSTAPALTAYLTKRGIVHGERHPELFKTKESFGQSAVELAQHMAGEEQVLFPYVQGCFYGTSGIRIGHAQTHAFGEQHPFSKCFGDV